MKKHLLLVLILCLCLPIQVSAKTELSEKQIKTMFQDLIEAVKKHDAKKVVSYFTPDAKISMDMAPQYGGKQSFGLKQYELMLKMGWKVMSDYEYEVKSIDIKLASDKQSAIVKDVTLENATVGKQKIVSKATEELSVILYQGQPKIEWLKAKVDMEIK